MGCQTQLSWMLPICCDKVPGKENTLWCTHIKQIWKWRKYLNLLLSRTISLRSLSTCIPWLCPCISAELTKCWSTPQESPLYIGRQYSRLWKLVFIQILHATRTSLPITTTAFKSFAFWTVTRVHWLKHNLYFIVLSNKELHHTDRSGSVYRYAELYAAIILWNDYPLSSLRGIDLWLCPTWWNFKGSLETRSCDVAGGWQRVTCGRQGSVVAF